MEIGDIVEHINKESKSGYPHDKRYVLMAEGRMKDISTGKWFDAAIYTCGQGMYIREKKDFMNKFKKVEGLK